MGQRRNHSLRSGQEDASTERFFGAHVSAFLVRVPTFVPGHEFLVSTGTPIFALAGTFRPFFLTVGLGFAEGGIPRYADSARNGVIFFRGLRGILERGYLPLRVPG